MLPNKIQHNQKHLIGYGTFSYNIDVPITTTPSPIPLNNNESIWGSISHDVVTNNSRIYFRKNGFYIITYSHEINRVGGTSLDAVFWVRENGNIALKNSSSRIHIGNPSSHSVLTVPFIKYFKVGDYVECMCQCDGNNDYSLINIAGSGSGETEIPNTPSVIITVEGYGV